MCDKQFYVDVTFMNIRRIKKEKSQQGAGISILIHTACTKNKTIVTLRTFSADPKIFGYAYVGNADINLYCEKRIWC